MKSNSNIRPASLLDLGDGNWHYNWNITEGVKEDEQGNETPDYNYDTAFIAGEPTVPKIVSAVVHEHYTDENISMMTALHQAAESGICEEPGGYSEYLSLVVDTRAAAEAAIEELAQAIAEAAEKEESGNEPEETEE